MVFKRSFMASSAGAHCSRAGGGFLMMENAVVYRIEKPTIVHHQSSIRALPFSHGNPQKQYSWCTNFIWLGAPTSVCACELRTVPVGFSLVSHAQNYAPHRNPGPILVAATNKISQRSDRAVIKKTLDRPVTTLTWFLIQAIIYDMGNIILLHVE